MRPAGAAARTVLEDLVHRHSSVQRSVRSLIDAWWYEGAARRAASAHMGYGTVVRGTEWRSSYSAAHEVVVVWAEVVVRPADDLRASWTGRDGHHGQRRRRSPKGMWVRQLPRGGAV